MQNNQHNVTVRLTPAQHSALVELAKTEGSDISSLLSRSIDLFVATYRVTTSPSSSLEAKIDKMHDQIIKLLVALMKLIGQTLYFSSLPVTTGPVKARLNEEGISVQWHQSEQFAIDLLSPPEASR